MSTTTMNAATPLPRTGRPWSLAPWLSRLVMLPPVLVLGFISIRFLTNPGHAIPGVALKAAIPLLIAERDHWVNMRSPACRDPARDCCGHGQQQRRRCKRLGIVHAHAHELGPDHSSKGHTNGYPDRHPHYNES